MSEAAQLLRDLEQGAPALARCLSPIGKRVVFPKGIPFQAGAARGKRLNATIGQVTDGAGQPMPIPSMADRVAGLDDRTSFLYSPQPGHPDIREAWLAWQLKRAGVGSHKGTLPYATHGLTHGLSLLGDLFVGPETTVVLPGPSWENYEHVYTMRNGAKTVSWPFFAGEGLNVAGFAEVLRSVTGPAFVVLNFPANPTGYAPTPEEAAAIVNVVAEHPGPLVVVVDDAYQGVVHEPGRITRSLYWSLVDAVDRSRTAVFKVDGATKELMFFPSRIGFLTADIEDPAAVAAFENKVNALVRGTVGSPPGPSQSLMRHALADIDTTLAELGELLATLAERYRVLKAGLASVASDRLRPLPFNAAYFAMVDLVGVDAEAARLALLDRDVGTVHLPGTNALRLAYCSTRVEDLPEIVSILSEVIEGL